MYMIQIDTYFLKNFLCATILIHVFCKNCEPEIVLQDCKSKPKTISGSQLLQNRWIIKQTAVHMNCFGKIEENMKLSGIYLFVSMKKINIKM